MIGHANLIRSEPISSAATRQARVDGIPSAPQPTRSPRAPSSSCCGRSNSTSIATTTAQGYEAASRRSGTTVTTPSSASGPTNPVAHPCCLPARTRATSCHLARRSPSRALAPSPRTRCARSLTSRPGPVERHGRSPVHLWRRGSHPPRSTGLRPSLTRRSWRSGSRGCPARLPPSARGSAYSPRAWAPPSPPRSCRRWPAR